MGRREPLAHPPNFVLGFGVQGLLRPSPLEARPRRAGAMVSGFGVPGASRPSLLKPGRAGLAGIFVGWVARVDRDLLVPRLSGSWTCSEILFFGVPHSEAGPGTFVAGRSGAKTFGPGGAFRAFRLFRPWITVRRK